MIRGESNQSHEAILGSHRHRDRNQNWSIEAVDAGDGGDDGAFCYSTTINYNQQ